MKRQQSFNVTAITVASLAMIGCANPQGNPQPKESAWQSDSAWYQSENAYDSTRIDVFYLVSTEVLSAQDSLGNVAWRSQLTPSDRSAIAGEMEWVAQNMFYEDFNLIAPYYHQFTFDAITKLSQAQFDSVYTQVGQEACEAFDYYMEHENHGRPFVLAGFSQGAMLTLDVLRHMTGSQHQQMTACYTIGYRLSEADLKHPHIQAAQNERDCGVVISFNSAQTNEAIWPLVSEGAETCINPINWHTDATPAEFTFDGTTNVAYVDQSTHTLIVSTDKPSYFDSFYDAAPFFLQAGASRQNLHHWDLLFYAPCIHDNALLRSKSASQNY